VRPVEVDAGAPAPRARAARARPSGSIAQRAVGGEHRIPQFRWAAERSRETAQEFVGAERAGRAGSPLAAGGALALFSGLALAALRQQQAPGPAPAGEAPLGLRTAQNAAEAERLDQTATLILAAMINAAKADGQVDQEELQRIVGRLRAADAEDGALDFVLSELRKPMDLEGLIRKAPDPQTAVQLYAASLLAIEVDTDAERQYLRRLAHGLGLDASVVHRVHQYLGVDPA
jgi:uncharacterized membrane protein YebE (DUF533 family)